MEVVSLCALRASGFEWQPSAGTFALTVFCKATFVLRPGRCALAPTQERLAERDEPWDDDPRRSLRVASDLAPYKRRADVLLVGHAYAPAEKPVRSFAVRFLAGEIDKSMEVWCDRSIRWRDGALIEGPRVVNRPLQWEWTAGGPDSDNPVGIRMDGSLDRQGMQVVPFLQPPDTYVSGRGDVFPPVGFGPIGAGWPPRQRALHRAAGRFFSERWQERPLPPGFDYAYFQVAPHDQQISVIRPDERIVLENLHPRHPRLVTSLPSMQPRAVADRSTGEREEVALVADTLWIDTDRGICTVVWRGRIGLRHAGERGRVAFWIDGEPIAALPKTAQLQDPRAGRDPLESHDAGTMTITPDDARAVALLPDFLAPHAGRRAPSGDASETLFAGLTEAKETLPFAAAPPGISSYSEASSPWGRAPSLGSEDGTGTLIGALAPAATAEDSLTLPFLQTSPGRSIETEPPPGWVAAPPEPMEIVAPLSVVERWSPPVEAVAIPALERKEAPLVIPPVEVAPPPMIGPLATPDMSAFVVGPEPESRVESKEGVAPPPAAAPVVRELPLSEYPLERCARIAASLGCRRADSPRILEENGLRREEWQSLDAHWSTEIRKETRRGRSTKLQAYDAAYVAQLEKERGPIQPEEYARIVVESERGNIDATLRSLGIPRTAHMRIERVWLRQLGTDATLGQRVKEYMATARDADL